MNPPAEEEFSPIGEICRLQFGIASKDLDARHQEQMADAQWPQTLELTKTYISERFDLMTNVVWQLVEQPWFTESAAGPFLERLKGEHLLHLNEVLRNVPAAMRQDIISSIKLKLSAKISRFLGRLQRRQCEKLTAINTEGQDPDGSTVVTNLADDSRISVPAEGAYRGVPEETRATQTGIPLAETPEAQVKGSRPGKNWKPGVLSIRHEILRIRQARITSIADICQRLGTSPRPPNASWRQLTWPEAYKSEEYRGAVKSWISRVK